VPTAFQDYYAILGVPRTATQKEIKTAFRKLARKHHPDLNSNDVAAERRFKEVNEANEVLSDPEKRRRYDELGPRWREYEAWEKAGKPGSSPFGGPQDMRGRDGSGVEYRTVSPDELEAMFGNADPFSDFFHSMFGGQTDGGAGAGQGSRARGRRTAPARRGEDVVGRAEISLAEAYAGTTRTVEIADETGQSRRIEVRIPPGVADGARVRAAGQGGRGSAGAGSGDLYMHVSIAPDPRFLREADNLRTSVEVPLDVALLGGDVPVPTLRGTTVHLTVPPASQNGAKLRLRGLGMPRLRGEGHGDLIAELSVRLPAHITPEVAALAEALRAQRAAGEEAGTP
jgi:curved DNA-binding protein